MCILSEIKHWEPLWVGLCVILTYTDYSESFYIFWPKICCKVILYFLAGALESFTSPKSPTSIKGE